MKNGEAFNRATYSLVNNFFSARMAQISLMGCIFTDIHTDRRTHRRRERARMNVTALDAVRARLGDGLNDSTGIVLDLVGLERSLAHDDVDVTGLVHLELDTTRFDFLHSFRGVVGHSAGLGVRHKAAWSEDLTELADFHHRLGRG